MDVGLFLSEPISLMKVAYFHAVMAQLKRSSAHLLLMKSAIVSTAFASMPK
jgi:hypothetical protein